MMWHPYKWVDDLAEKSGWWIVPYVIFLRIFMWKFLHSISDQQGYTIAIIFFSAVFFWGATIFFKLYKDSCKYYKTLLYSFTVIYFIVSPIYVIYFLTYHPLLGSTISCISFLALAYSYAVVKQFKEKKQG